MDDKFTERLVWWLSNDGLWKKVAAHFGLDILSIEEIVRHQVPEDSPPPKNCATLVFNQVSDLLPYDIEPTKFRTSWLVFLRGCDLTDVAMSLAVQCYHVDSEWMTAPTVTLRSPDTMPTVSTIDEAFYPRMTETQRGYAQYKVAMHGLLELCMPAIAPLVRAFISVVPSRPHSLAHPTFMSTSQLTLGHLCDSRTLEWLIITPEFGPLLVFVFACASNHIAKNCRDIFTDIRIRNFRDEINDRLRSDLVSTWLIKPAELLIERMCAKYRELLDALAAHDDNWKVLLPDPEFSERVLVKNQSLFSEFHQACLTDRGPPYVDILVWLRRSDGKKFSELVELFRPFWEVRCSEAAELSGSVWERISQISLYDYPLSVSALGNEARKFTASQ